MRPCMATKATIARLEADLEWIKDLRSRIERAESSEKFWGWLALAGSAIAQSALSEPL